MFNGHGRLKVTRQGVWERLTDVVVFPHVAHRHVAHQQHSNPANAALLHIDVLVVISVVAWNAKGPKKKYIYEQQIGNVKCSLRAARTHNYSQSKLVIVQV